MKKRYKKTLKLVNDHLSIYDLIYDLGKTNEMSRIMQFSGYSIQNNIGNADLDLVQSEITAISQKSEGMPSPDVTTAFQILEHLTNPFTVLQAIKTDQLLCTVPLNVWFSKAYWGEGYDRHFHEFEQRQFFLLLDKAGWEVIDSGRWWLTDKIGIRPFLRLFFPSYLWVLAKRKT